MSNGCGKCWEEFKGWLKAFTPIETLLTILEAVLLVLLIAFIVFLILHFLSCPTSEKIELINTLAPSCRTEQTREPVTPSAPSTKKTVTSKTTRPTCTYTRVTAVQGDHENVSADPSKETLAGAGGTAVPQNATQAVATQDSTRVTLNHRASAMQAPTTVTLYDETSAAQTDTEDEAFHDGGSMWPESDGELADDDEKRLVLALVKIKPSGLTFGCILTVVSERWTVTAASCLDSIEEVDSLDNFVIIDNYDEPNKGRSHAVTDVRVHPLYEGRNKSYDLALLRSEDDLGRDPVLLPTLLDYFKLTVGEAVKILGFGPFRTLDSQNKRVHSATVHVLPIKHCTPSDSMERHLVPLSPVFHGRCGVGPVCGGVLHSRGTPCNYCAGAPLLRARVLLGVMADHEQCGAACEPALHANIAAAQEWIELVLAD